MFTADMVEEIIEECFARSDEFNDRFNGRAQGKSVRIITSGVDGGGLSTYGRSFAIDPSNHEYECRDGYIAIFGEYAYTDANASYQSRRRKRSEITCIPYSAIIAIECKPSVQI